MAENLLPPPKQFNTKVVDVYTEWKMWISSFQRELAKTCEFGGLEAEMLRDQIVQKCYSKHLKKRLLSQDDLNIARTVTIARSNESAIKETRLLCVLATK